MVRQMEWEQTAADALGIPWSVFLHTPLDIRSSIVKRHDHLPVMRVARYAMLRWRFYQWLERAAENADLVLLRHSVHDPFEAAFVRRLGSKVLTVHHTLEVPELAGGGALVGKAKAALESLIGGYVLGRASSCVGVTEEILRYELARMGALDKGRRGFLYPNGVQLEDEILLDGRGDVPEFVFIASSFVDWHGLDLLIGALEADATPCVVRLIGAVPDQLLTRCAADSRIVLHGLMPVDALASIMSSAWVGLSSFALFRKGMVEACTLKVREYLANGLPVYAAHRDAGFPDSFPFFRNGPVKLRDMLSFALACRSIPREEVRISAAPYISKGGLLANLYSDLGGWFSAG
ncbi:glycosyltransferase family 4 protein [Rhodocyclus tenuis]|uniref:Glycosyltransferase family 4 protein n=1 Tax=Rhodocyclus gracilis TaxID=2929842 RepID=A0ABX0WJY6_9RHOO|nr:glycosyltransferase family 1 protein [Rhodocyclus gracilis]MRD72310.1 glycosyltransferase family 1 protein [Rhodocyclus gracilis]NJA89601.1 glycosyltransferase family 4 protein [Rhodocyclus gracilis]